MSHNSTELFNNYANLYNMYRLSYNDDVINDVIIFISNNLKIKFIADIGAGTGILSQQLLKFEFYKYYSIEPNLNMQKYSILNDEKKIINHINGTSCITNLPNSCIDVIFVGTAIHWFEPKKTLIEFKRILKNNGFLVILFNGYVGEIGQDLCIMRKKYTIKNKEPSNIKTYDKDMKNYSNSFYTIISRNTRELTLDQFIGLELSISTSPQSSDANYEKFISELKCIFNKYKSIDNKFLISNKTTALISNKLL